MINLKNNFKLIKYKNILLFCFFIILCYLINIKYDILGLFIDDLTSFSYFPNNNIFKYAFKFYSTATRYRPFYEFFQYIAFFITGHNPHFLFIINIVFNGFIASYLFLKVDKLFINKYLSFTISILYLITHFACYQITQATGLMENIATLLALMIFFRCIDFISNCNLRDFFIIDILYLLISFTHERYMSLFGLIVMTLLITCIYDINDDKLKNIKVCFIGFAILIVMVIFIIFIRYMALGRFIPAGTSGSYVTETFTFSGLLKNIKEELLYILGINIGIKAMSGIRYEMLDLKSKTIIVFHIVCIGIILLLYIIFKILKIKNDKIINLKIILKYFYIDILFLTFIMLTIIFSSVTIYVEKRFILIPFISIYIYIFYMISQLYKYIVIEQKIILASIFILIFTFGMIISRFCIENRYRKENENTYFMIDQKRINSLASITVYKYGNEILDEKQIYIVQNSFLYTDRYLENFFTIYQKNYELRPIKVISDMDKEQIENIDIGKSIFIIEDRSNDKYIEKNFNKQDLLNGNY